MAADNKNFIVKNGLTAQGGIQSDSDVDVTGDISATGDITATGTITAATLSGSLAATNLTGNIDSDRITQINASKVVNLPASTDSSAVQAMIDSSFTEDFTLAAINALDASATNWDSDLIPPLPASRISSGTFDSARIPTLVLGTDTQGAYVESVTAGVGIKSAGISGSTPTVTVDSAFIRSIPVAGTGVVYTEATGTFAIGQAVDSTDNVKFANVEATNFTSYNEFNIFDSANGEEVAHLTGDPDNGLIIHSHAHATDGGIRFQIHNAADSDYLIISRPTGISFVNRRARDLADPTQDQDAATKSYVDGVTQGLSIRDPAKAATVTNLTNTNDITSYVYDSGAKGFGAKILITATIGLDSVDGYTLQLNDRVIVKNETGANLPFNGIYTWDSAKGLTRATDMDSGSEFNGGEFVFVQEGTVNGGNGFSQKDNITLVGDSDVHFVQFSGAGQITAGQGIVKDGNTLDVDLSGTPGLEFFANQLQAKVDNSTIERVAGGLAVKDGGISVDKFLTTGGTGVTVDNILSNAGHTTDNISAAQIGTTNQFYNTTKGDSDTRALVDSAFVRPFARAAITAGANITYDSATGVIAGVAAYGDADVTALVNSDYVQDRADSAYIKTVTGIDAGTLGGQAIGAFLRSDATDAYTSGTLTFNTGTTVTAADGATVNFDMADGTAPFSVTSTTNVPNLNASSLSGVASGSFLRSDTSDNYTSGTLTFDNGTTVAFNNTTVSTNAPFTVASTVKVTNLNADLLDDQNGSYYRIDILDSTGTVLNT